MTNGCRVCLGYCPKCGTDVSTEDSLDNSVLVHKPPIQLDASYWLAKKLQELYKQELHSLQDRIRLIEANKKAIDNIVEKYIFS